MAKSKVTVISKDMDTSSTVIAHCTCKSDWQDERYGKGKRVFNMKKDKNKHEGRCTVCASVRTI